MKYILVFSIINYIVHSIKCSQCHWEHWINKHLNHCFRENKTLIGHYIFNNQSKHNLFYVFVFKIIQFNSYCWFITTELRQSTLSHAWTDLISIQETYFLHMAHHSLVASRTICLGPSETLKSPIKMQKKRKNGAKQTAKRILVYSMRAETKM